MFESPLWATHRAVRLTLTVPSNPVSTCFQVRDGGAGGSGKVTASERGARATSSCLQPPRSHQPRVPAPSLARSVMPGVRSAPCPVFPRVLGWFTGRTAAPGSLRARQAGPRPRDWQRGQETVSVLWTLQIHVTLPPWRQTLCGVRTVFALNHNKGCV